MTTKKPKNLPYKRKREGKTNYKKRRTVLLSGKPRLAVRFTNKQIIAQLIEFKTTGDRVLAAVASSSLKKYGWGFSFKNLPAAYLAGYWLAKKALQKGLKEAVPDFGFKPPVKGNKNYACLKGALDGGLKIPHSPEVYPPEDRIQGKHIQDYAARVSKEQAQPGRIIPFSSLKANPAKITESFQQTKKMIEQKA